VRLLYSTQEAFMMKDELKFYSRNRSWLNKTYCNEYILIHGCRVVGHLLIQECGKKTFQPRVYNPMVVL